MSRGSDRNFSLCHCIQTSTGTYLASYTKVKGKIATVLFFLTEHHAMKAYWGSGGIDPLILDLGIRWR
jgi:hypothetical protein